MSEHMAQMASDGPTDNEREIMELRTDLSAARNKAVEMATTIKAAEEMFDHGCEIKGQQIVQRLYKLAAEVLADWGLK